MQPRLQAEQLDGRSKRGVGRSPACVSAARPASSAPVGTALLAEPPLAWLANLIVTRLLQQLARLLPGHHSVAISKEVEDFFKVGGVTVDQDGACGIPLRAQLCMGPNSMRRTACLKRILAHARRMSMRSKLFKISSVAVRMGTIA